MRNFIDTLHESSLLAKLFPTVLSRLRDELEDCKSVLDLGCGPSSPLQYSKNIKYSVGVEPFKPYIEESQKKKIHTKYIKSRIEDLKFPKNSFDAVIMVEVLEHLPKSKGVKILRMMEKWAKKKVIITTPNGFLEQNEIDDNKHQKHLSGWEIKDLKRFGFVCHGLAGLKFLRKERFHNTKEATLLSSIRYKPELFWFIIATLSQAFTYYFPQYAFELFAVKKIQIK